MNAMPNQSNGYQRVIIPPNVRFERNVEMGKLEYFDDYKARKSILNSRMESQRTVPSKNMAANNISEFNRISHITNEPVMRARQITPAYEVQKKPYVSSANYNKTGAKSRATARNIGSEQRTNTKQASSGYQRIMPKASSEFYFETRYPSYNRNMAYASGGSYAYAGAGGYGNYGGEVVQPRRQPRVEEETYVHTEKETQVQKKVKTKRSGFVSTICVVIFTFIVLSGLLTRYAQISNLSYNNAKIEANIASMEEELQRIQMDIALKDDLGNIQARAENELGMAHPGDERTVYLKPNTESEYNGGVYVSGENTSDAQTAQDTPNTDDTVQITQNDTTPQQTTPPANNADGGNAVGDNPAGQTNNDGEIDFKALFNQGE